MNLAGTMNNSDENFIKKIVQLMERDESSDASAESLQWSKNLFRARIAEPKKSFAQKILAVLQIDLAPNKAAFGERSAASSQARQMLFEAGDAAVDLRISENGASFDVRGQILGADFKNAAVKIGEFETTANELGEFVIKSVPHGVYQMNVQAAENEIVIENLELK